MGAEHQRLLAAAGGPGYANCCSIRTQVRTETSTCYMAQRPCGRTRNTEPDSGRTGLRQNSSHAACWSHTHDDHTRVLKTPCGGYSQGAGLQLRLSSPPDDPADKHQSHCMLTRSLIRVHATLLAQNITPMQVRRSPTWLRTQTFHISPPVERKVDHTSAP